jgi:glycogen operon protein
VVLRERQCRAMLATLLLSFGVPILLGGDELGRSQQGNINAYYQDNAITWFDWSAVDSDLLGFTKQLVALRRSHPYSAVAASWPELRPPRSAGSPPLARR